MELNPMTDSRVLTIPESVFEYLTDPRVRAGADSILEYDAAKVPPGLEWDELPRFYQAALSAALIRSDWACTLAEFWALVWPRNVEGWTALSIDEQTVADKDGRLSLNDCWDGEWLGRRFEKRVSSVGSASKRSRMDVLYLGVSLSLDGISIGLSIDMKTEDFDASAAGFVFDEEADGWWMPERKITSKQVDIAVLTEAAGKVIQSLP
jgi:hypothetical protein